MKVCFVTSSRADYGLLSTLMKLFNKEKNFKLQCIVTGSHLSKNFGHTYKDILKDKIKINNYVDIGVEKNNYETEITKSLGLAITKISLKLKNLKPDLIILLGDRYEIFASCIAAFIHQIPICHLHGGELTSGVLDDGFRHSISKMANLHFVSHNKHKKRLAQLGENKKNIFVVGGFGVDLINSTNFKSKKIIEKEMSFKFGKKNLLVTYHPETIKGSDSIKDFKNILQTLDRFKNTKIIFTEANFDLKGNMINNMINNFVKKDNNNRISFKSMGNLNYFSVIRYVDAVIGNSSSGLLEVPSLKKITINIGARQEDRLKALSVIDLPADKKKLYNVLKKILFKKKKFNKKIFKNPYGNGKASIKTFNILKKLFKNKKSLTTKKKFIDL